MKLTTTEKILIVSILVVLLCCGISGYIWYKEQEKYEEHQQELDRSILELEMENKIAQEDYQSKLDSLNQLKVKNHELDALLVITNKGIVKLKQQHNEKINSIRTLSTDSTILLLSRNLSEESSK